MYCLPHNVRKSRHCEEAPGRPKYDLQAKFNFEAQMMANNQLILNLLNYLLNWINLASMVRVEWLYEILKS